MNESICVSFAEQLSQAENQQLPIAPLMDQFPGLSIEQAYQIQLAGVQQ